MDDESAPPPAPGPETILGGGTPPPEAFTPSFDGALQADGTFAEGWHTKALGAEYNGPLAGVKSVADVDKMLRDNIAAARAKTDGMVRVPGEGAKPEEIAAFRKALGVPDTAEGYGALRPETIPEGVWDADAEKALQSVAHKHNLTPAALKDIVGLYAGQIDGQMKMGEAQAKEFVAGETSKLRGEWGDSFEPNVRNVVRLAATVGLDPTNPIFQSADVVRAFHRITSMMSEDKLINGATVNLAVSPQEQAKDVMTNPKNPHYEAYQRGDANAVALVNNLLAQP